MFDFDVVRCKKSNFLEIEAVKFMLCIALNQEKSEYFLGKPHLHKERSCLYQGLKQHFWDMAFLNWSIKNRRYP